MYLYLETDPLFIRAIKTEDAAFFLDLLNSEGWIRFIGDRDVRDLENASAYIEKILLKKNYDYNLLELKDQKQAIGIITLIERENELFPDIGFALLPEFERQGHAFEGCSAYLKKLKRVTNTIM